MPYSATIRSTQNGQRIVIGSYVQLFSYKMTHDTGFAPNPFWGYLTLATCKPGIRRTKAVGDWVAGFSSKTLNRDPVGKERLVYLMRVDEKLPISDYYRERRFGEKVPNSDSHIVVSRAGDNIYRPLNDHAKLPKDFEQLRNPNHWDGTQSCGKGASRSHDISGVYVLIARVFAYFGREALPIPDNVRPNVPYGMSRNGSRMLDEGKAQEFITYVLDQANGKSVIAQPHEWPDLDESWRQ